MTQIVMGPEAHELKQLESKYIQRDAALLNEEIKQRQRDRVMNHILDNHAGEYMKLFSLPGMWWTFENQISEAFRGNIKFVAVERNFEILRHGVTFMPGHGRNSIKWELPTYTLDGHESSNARILWCEARVFMRPDSERGGSHKNRHRYSHAFQKWTAAWLDFQSPLNEETLYCLRRSEQFLNKHCERVPLAMTFMSAREQRKIGRVIRHVADEHDDCHEKRIDMIQRWCNQCWTQRRLEITDWNVYLSAGGSPMLSVCALAHKI